MEFTEPQLSRYHMRNRRSFTPLSILFSMFLILIILGVSIVSFIELGIIAVWGFFTDKLLVKL